MNIAMWSGPRNLSTALMYAFAARSDCAVWDEPFYSPYLAATGIDHPMREAVIAAHDADAGRVAAACAGPAPQQKPLFYQKHMTLHMIPEFPRGFMRACTNVFLIRHPARVIASYARKREGPTLSDIGFVQQAALFDEVADDLGAAPLVLDAADVLADPAGTLLALCTALQVPFQPQMLHWPAGGNAADGVWAAHWYGAVHNSTGFAEPEGAPPVLPAEYQPLLQAALPFYKRLFEYRICPIQADLQP